MKSLARRDQARLSLTEQGRATLYSLLGDGGNHDGGDTSPRVRTPMPSSLALTSLIRRRLMALTVRSRRPVALGGLDDAVAAVSLQSKCRHTMRATACEPSKKKPRRSGAVSPIAPKERPVERTDARKKPRRTGVGLSPG